MILFPVGNPPSSCPFMIDSSSKASSFDSGPAAGDSGPPGGDSDHAAGISIHEVTVRYSAQAPVLNGLSLEIAPGEILALVGASGSGKSTLLRSIAKLLEPSEGRITLQGAHANRRTGDLAYVFQDATLLPWRTVRQNVQLPFEIGARGGSDRRTVEDPLSTARNPSDRVLAALESVGLAPATHRQFPRELSGGMRMRTSIARALVTDPSILLLDEPFAALDDLLRTKLNDLILDLWSRRRRTIVFVTHNIAEAAYLSHRVAVLGKGSIFKILDNSLAWPRSREQRTSLEFAEFYGQISQTLSEAS